MYKDGILTISDWTKGMGDSAYTGFANISNCEVFDTPGIAKMAYSAINAGSTSMTDIPVAQVRDSYGSIFVLSFDGKVYKNGTLSTTIGGTGYDLCIYNDYLIVSTYTTGIGKLHAYGPLNNAPQWFTNWQTGFNTGKNYYMKLIPAKDGNLYITSADSIGKISNFSGGIPAVTPTAISNTSVMLLPTNNACVTAVEVGSYMLIGTQGLTGSWSSRNNSSVANLYLWDKADTKPTSLTGSLNENSIQSMISYGNRVYIVAGNKGNLYVTDTTTFQKIKRIPWKQQETRSDLLMQAYPNAICFNELGNLLIGTSTQSFGSNASTYQHGVWEISLSNNYPTVFKHKVSNGSLGQSTPLYIGFLTQSLGSIFIGWSDGSTYAVDYIYPNSFGSSVSVIESQMLQVGSRLNRKIFQNIEFTLGKPLADTQTITISYRKNLTENYTQIGTFSYSTLGSVISHNTKALIDEAEILQIKIQLSQPSATQIGNIELLKVTIW